MSSSLFDAQVSAVDGDRATFSLTPLDPSAEARPSATLALILLHEPIRFAASRGLGPFEHLGEATLGREIEPDATLDEPWLRKNARAFVKCVAVVKGGLAVQATDPAWVEHLRVGMKWKSLAYDAGEAAPTTPRAPSDRPKVAPPIADREPKAGFRVAKTKDRFYHHVGPVHHPLLSAMHYVADPILTDAAAMAAAGAKLVGEPVLVVPKKGLPEVGALLMVLEDGPGLFLWTETDKGYHGQPYAFRELRSMGRAWLASPSAASPALGKAAAKEKAAGKKKARRRAPRG